MEPLHEIKRDMLELKTSQLRIERALLGDDTFQQRGFVHDIADLKRYQEKDEKLKAKIAGGVTLGIPVLGAAWALFIDWVKGKT